MCDPRGSGPRRIRRPHPSGCEGCIGARRHPTWQSRYSTLFGRHARRRAMPSLTSSLALHAPGVRISHTSVMDTGLALGGDVEQALESVGVPSYVLDKTGIVRWINAAAERLVGDVRGRHFTSVVAPEDSRRARELFSRKVLGTSPATEANGVLVTTTGRGWPWRSARHRS